MTLVNSAEEPVCPDCIEQAGCPSIGCPCTGKNGEYFYAPNKPENELRPAGCDECAKEECLKIFVKCGTPLRICGSNEIDWIRREGYGPPF